MHIRIRLRGVRPGERRIRRPSELFRWVAFVFAAAAGATFLLVNAARPLSKDAKGGVAFQTPFCACVVGGHILFGMVVKLWFFTHF